MYKDLTPTSCSLHVHGCKSNTARSTLGIHSSEHMCLEFGRFRQEGSSFVARFIEQLLKQSSLHSECTRQFVFPADYSAIAFC